jgi:hypothetical protein
MGQKGLVALVAAIGLLAIPSTAAAGGWAGSRYDKDDCTYDVEADMLSCEAWFTDEFFTTMQLGTFDPTCASSLRIIERTGWLVTTYRGWGIFFGRVPVRHKELVGNEDSFEETWRDYTDVDRGCLM